MTDLALVVLSGGLDSATCLGVAVERHGAKHTEAISFDYGQRHRNELAAAASLCSYYDVRHVIAHLSPLLFHGGVLTTAEPVPDMSYSDLPDGTMSPSYVPFRNGNLLASATAYADSRIRNAGTALIYCGMHAEDAAGFAYADCTPEFLGAVASAIHTGTYGRVRLQAIFQHAEKHEIIRRGLELGVPYELTVSCYRGEDVSCGTCATCRARLDAFERAGAVDPIPYRRVSSA